MPWRKLDHKVLYYLPNIKPTPHIAGFDLVNTLIWSDNGDYTVKGDHWVWRNESIAGFLCDLFLNHWTIVIFSNATKGDRDVVKSRLDDMRNYLNSISPGIDFFFFASMGSPEYNKPEIGMWLLFEEAWKQQRGEPLHFSEDSFYVGDRAGGYVETDDPMFLKGEVNYVRQDELDKLGLDKGTRLGDDSLFALRIGLNFYLPDDLPFQKTPTFNPDEQELIIMVGQTRIGKTTWASTIASQLGYYHIASEDVKSLDNEGEERIFVSKNKATRFRKIKQLLDQGYSLIVDATHPSRSSRQELIDIAKEKGVPVRIFWVSRPGRPYNEQREHPVPEVALRKYTKNFERPSDNEAPVIRLA